MRGQRDAAVEQGEQLLADELAAPAAQRAHVGGLSGSHARHDRLQVGA
jgi:hypothetical protein